MRDLTPAQQRFQALADHLVSLGLLATRPGGPEPLQCLDHVPGETGRVRTLFRLDATALQRVSVFTEIRDWDWSERRPRGLLALAQAIEALSASDRQKVLLAVCALVLSENPDLARRLGVDLDGDEEV